VETQKAELEEKPEGLTEGKEELTAEEAAVAPAEEEEAPEEEELEIVEEKFYDLNLGRIWNAPREKRTPRAVRFLRDFVERRMKTSEVSISEEANSMLWQRGISKPPRKIRVRVVKDKEGRVIVFPGEGK
jgi:ribosomal protein L31E